MRGRDARRWAAGLLAAGMLLSGCTTGSDGKEGTAQQEAGGDSKPRGPGSGSRGDLPAQPEKGEFEAGRGPHPEASVRSTFALDVDTASYSYAKRQLGAGTLPRPDTVRPEEFVNSFRQDHRRPKGNGFAVSLDGARTGDDDWTVLRVGLATRDETAAEARRGPASLTFVVDVSGSMAEPGRLDLVKDSMRTMVGRLRDDDAVSVVSFSDEARTVLPMTVLGDKSGRAKARKAVSELRTEASTNLQAGIRTGYRQAVDGRRDGATNRVVLLSDALANTGATGAEEILEEVARARKDHGITLFGVGVGSEYGDSLMESLTNKGDGNTVYVSDRKEAERVFVHDLARNVEVAARDAKAQVTFDQDTVAAFRLIGYDNRRVAGEDFRDDSVDGGEIGPGQTVTALYAVRLKDGADGRVATATVRWLDPKTRRPAERSGQIATSRLSGGLWKDGSPRLRTAAVATYFADALRAGGTGRYRGGGSRALPGDPGPGRLHKEAVRAARETEDRDVEELARLISRARDLAD